jgi:hypothetical protein
VVSFILVPLYYKRSPWYPLDKRLGGVVPTAGLDAVEYIKSLTMPQPGIEV